MPKPKAKTQKTLEAMIKRGNALANEKNFTEAIKVLEDARKGITPANAFQIDYDILNVLVLSQSDRLLDFVNEFLKNYENATHLNPEKRKDFLYMVSNGFSALKENQKAKKYAEEFLKLLNSDDHRRKLWIYEIFFDIADYECNYASAQKYIDQALACEGIEDDPVYHFHFLFSKCMVVDRPEILQSAKKMCDLFCKFCNSKLKEKKFDVFYTLADAYLIQKKISEAETCFWSIYNDEEALKEDEENISKYGLVTLYKVGKRIEEVSKLEAEKDVKPPINFLNLYEKIAVDFYNLNAYELAYDWYKKMWNKASATGNQNKTILEPLTKCSYNFAYTQGDFQECLKLHDQLLIIYERDSDVPNDKRLAVKIQRAHTIIDIRDVSFEDKIKEMLKLEEEEKSAQQAVDYLAIFIRLLEKNEDDEDAAQYLHKIPELQKLLEENLKKVNHQKFERLSCTPDQYDAIPDDEILQIVEEKWRTNDATLTAELNLPAPN